MGCGANSAGIAVASIFLAPRNGEEKSQHDWLAVDACGMCFVERRFVHVRPIEKNLFEFPVGKEIMDAPTWLEMGFYRRVACNSVEVSFCVPGSAACGSTCRRKGLVTSLCWFASIHFYLRLSQDFVFYRKRHPFQDLFCSTSTAPVASGIAAPPLACHWRFAKLPADQLTLQGNRDSNSYSCHQD